MHTVRRMLRITLAVYLPVAVRCIMVGILDFVIVGKVDQPVSRVVEECFVLVRKLEVDLVVVL